MSASAQSPVRPGLVECLVRGFGQRPFRQFLMVWMVVFVLWGLVGFVGFKHTRLSGDPPLPEAVPYADFLPGGKQSHDRTIDLPRDRLPNYDPSLARREVGIGVRQGREGEPNRLYAYAPESLGVYGWPWSAIGWVSHVAWDISDPAKPYPPFADFFSRARFSSLPSTVNVQFVNEDASRASAVNVLHQGLVLYLAAPQTVAAVAVGPPWLWFQVRQRQRRRAGRCLACGQMLDPHRRPQLCPECGTPTAAATDTPQRQPIVSRLVGRPGRLMLLLCAILVVIWAAVQVLSREQIEVEPLGTRLEKLAEVAPEFRDFYSSRDISRSVDLTQASYGWPMQLLWVEKQQTYTVKPDESPVPTQSQWQPGVRVEFDEVWWAVTHNDRSLITIVSFYWATALVEIATLQVVATVLVGAFGVCAWFRRRRKPSS